MAGKPYFDLNTWYRIVNCSTTGLGYALDVVNDGFPNGYADLTLNPVGVSDGQYWRLLFSEDNNYALYSMWPGEGYYLGVLVGTIKDGVGVDHLALFTEAFSQDSDYYWKVTLLDNGTFRLVNTQTSLQLSDSANGTAWAISKIDPVANDTSATVTAGTGVSTVGAKHSYHTGLKADNLQPSYTCSNPSCTIDATSLNGSPFLVASSIQKSTPAFFGSLDASTISQSIAFATFPLTTQSITPSRAADPTSSAPTTALTPNGKPAIRTAVGIGVGAAIGVLLLCGFVVCIFMRRRRRALANHEAHGTEDTMPCHTEAKPELSAQEQQCAEPSSKLSAQDSQCAEPTSKLSTQGHQSAELSGDQGTMPRHIRELGGPGMSRKYGSNNSTLLELE